MSTDHISFRSRDTNQNKPKVVLRFIQSRHALFANRGRHEIILLIMNFRTEISLSVDIISGVEKDTSK